jgi:lysophospholipase L1-like esterase
VKRLPPVVANLLLAAGSLAVGALVVEAAARLLTRGAHLRPHTTRGSFVRFHPLLGWDKPPGIQGWLHRPEYSVRLEVNAKGLRGPDRPYEKPAGVHRTLLVGDSFTEGYTVAEEKTTRAVLEAELRRGGLSAEVVNGGTMGYSTDQELLFYQAEGHRYQPDLVVVMLCTNDIYFNTTGEQGKPWFDLEDGRLVLQGSPVRPPKRGPWQRGPEARTLSAPGWHESVALRLLAERTASGNPRLHRVLARVGLVEGMKPQPIPMEMTPLGTLHPEVKKMWAVTQAVLAVFKAEVEAAGGRFALFYIPDRYELSEPVWELTQAQYDLGKRFSPHRFHERVVRLSRDLDIALIDPHEAFLAAESKRPAYFEKDGHWNELGHEIAAKAIAEHVRRGR